METVSTNIASVTQEQIYKEFLRLGMEQLIAQDLSKRYYHNELTYRDLENLEKQFDIKFDNLIFKIDSVEKNLQKDISNLDVKIDTVEKNLNAKIDSVEKNLQKDISNLDTKIDSVEKNLNAKIDNVEKNLNLKIDGLNIKIDNVEKNLMSLSEMLKWALGIMGAMSITMIAGLIFAFISK
ncbi:Bdr family repetitive protein [Borreliella burgdorferi]|uniref:Bdr family repetitive protein n=2 Tax=Borreliella burgdorferi TaxID=139 RepID=UPI001E5C9972|nr:Bdr family repetitive protein [Borreliella burgdorferi]MCD2385168.1 Bdr family repetitive protein [Borreliella burgdorferi]